MPEFWEASFRDKQTMWGFTPADSAAVTAAFFHEQGLQNILIPGFGYGRNAKVFTDRDCTVTGIEISATAIKLARRHYGEDITIHHGGVSDMPFDDKLYDGIFCYALIHLLDEEARAKLISDCYRQLRPGGYLVFVAISTNTPAYGEGTPLGKDYFRTRHDVELFYYNEASVEQEFGPYGLLEAKEIEEPTKNTGGRPSQVFWEIRCRKEVG